MDEDILVFNGIDGSTGRPSWPALRCAQLVRAVLGQADPANLLDLRTRRKQDEQSEEALLRLQQLAAETVAQLRADPADSSTSASVQELTASLQRLEQTIRERQHLGVREGIDANDLRQAGWGIIFANTADPQLQEALAPLLELRCHQAGERFRIFSGARGYRTGGKETKARFLVRNGATAAGPVSPEAVPYYLLIVGDPGTIPFEFQHQLDVQYAVGRVYFESAAEYAQYARSVVAAEKQQCSLPRTLTFFDVANPDDRATQLSSRQLVAPLHELFASGLPGWNIHRLSGADARKEQLQKLLQAAPPSLLFTASHGMEFAAGSEEQRRYQGALLCADWPGPSLPGKIPRQHYFAAEDVQEDLSFLGLLVFMFACYSAGTPAHDSFSCSGQPCQRAPTPFVAALPQRLLSHPRGGALAVIGHVDRAWGYSFTWSGGAQRVHTAAIESTLRRLLQGERIGYAMEYLNQRYAELVTMLSDELTAVRNLRQPDERALAELWTAAYDARGYCVIGDPAVRLPAVAAR